MTSGSMAKRSARSPAARLSDCSPAGTMPPLCQQTFCLQDARAEPAVTRKSGCDLHLLEQRGQDLNLRPLRYKLTGQDYPSKTAQARAQPRNRDRSAAVWQVKPYVHHEPRAVTCSKRRRASRAGSVAQAGRLRRPVGEGSGDRAPSSRSGRVSRQRRFLVPAAIPAVSRPSSPRTGRSAILLRMGDKPLRASVCEHHTATAAGTRTG